MFNLLFCIFLNFSLWHLITLATRPNDVWHLISGVAQGCASLFQPGGRFPPDLAIFQNWGGGRGEFFSKIISFMTCFGLRWNLLLKYCDLWPAVGNFLGIVTVPKSPEFKPAAGENFRILWLTAGENYWKLLLNSTRWIANATVEDYRESFFMQRLPSKPHFIR